MLRMHEKQITRIIFIILGLFMSLPSVAQNDVDGIRIKTVRAGGAVRMLSAENGFGGGNVAASIGADGILLVDNMYSTVTPKIIAALKEVSDSNIRFVINTHFHADHIQGNTVLSASSGIIAHQNVRKRLLAKPGLSTASLPQITFTEKLTIHFNGEEILLFHLPNGHTDGDVFVYFKTSNVIHLGDTYFNGMFPAVYKEGGGDILQMIKNLEKILAEIPADIAVIPGHGPLSGKKELAAYVDMLKETTIIAIAAIAAGKTLQQSTTEKILNKYDELGTGGAQTTDQYLAMLYKILSP